MIIPDFAKQSKHKMLSRGSYKNGWPFGAVVHFTAGHDGAENCIELGVKNGYTYWCIQRDGSLYCAHNADQWGYHAGESRWKSKLLGSVSDDLIGIEICSYGKVTKIDDNKFKTWFGKIIGKEEVRYTPGKDNQQKGWYHTYTKEQENTLINTIHWLKEQRPGVFDYDLVLGHDEVSGIRGIGYFRKNDPGASLSMTMDEFRILLKSQAARF